MSEIDNCWNNNHRLETRTFDKTRTIIAFCLDCNKELERKEYKTDTMYELAKNMCKAYNLHKKIHRLSDL